MRKEHVECVLAEYWHDNAGDHEHCQLVEDRFHRVLVRVLVPFLW